MEKTNLKIQYDLQGPIELSTHQIIKKIHRTFSSPIKRILLVNPPQFPFKDFDPRIAKNRRYYTFPPYGAGVLCASLKAEGFEVEIVDMNYEVLAKRIADLNKKKLSKQNFETMWRDLLKARIEKIKPDVIGLSVMFTMSHSNLIQISKFLKTTFPQIPLIAGGVHITNAPNVVLKEAKNIDFVLLYESDTSFLSFLNFINGNESPHALNQIGCLIEGKYIAIAEKKAPSAQSLDIIPDYSKLPIGEYSQLGEIGTYRFWRPKSARVSSVLSNRGCRAKCSFCSVRNFNGMGVRARSVKSVVDEIQRLKELYGVSHISWLDDDLYYDTKRTLDLFNEITRRRLGITWEAGNGVIASAAALHPELIHASAESGCIGLYFGIESGNPEILKRVHKPSTVKHYLEVGKIMKSYPKIFTKGYMIIGFPKETLGQIKDSIDVAVEMNLDWCTTQILTPLPSTEIFKEMVEMGLIGKEEIKKSDDYTLFVVRESERQRKMERNKQATDSFYDYLSGDLNRVPSKQEINCIWLLFDYKVNYERILTSTEPLFLVKMQRFLSDVADRMTIDNPLPNYYLGIIEGKLGNEEESNRRFELSRKYLSASHYWQQRFKVLSLDVEEKLETLPPVSTSYRASL